MTSIWVESLGRSFEGALALLESAIRDCTDELWESSMWGDPSGIATWTCTAPTGSSSSPTACCAMR